MIHVSKLPDPCSFQRTSHSQLCPANYWGAKKRFCTISATFTLPFLMNILRRKKQIGHKNQLYPGKAEEKVLQCNMANPVQRHRNSRRLYILKICSVKLRPMAMRWSCAVISLILFRCKSALLRQTIVCLPGSLHDSLRKSRS